VGLTKSRPHDRTAMIITTAEHIIKAAQADRINGAIMLYAVNCQYVCNATPKKQI